MTALHAHFTWSQRQSLTNEWLTGSRFEIRRSPQSITVGQRRKHRNEIEEAEAATVATGEHPSIHRTWRFAICTSSFAYSNGLALRIAQYLVPLALCRKQPHGTGLRAYHSHTFCGIKKMNLPVTKPNARQPSSTLIYCSSSVYFL